MLFQSVLIEKACEVYSKLSVEQSAGYEIVKREILKAYELVPEAYRQQFHESKCKEGKLIWSLLNRRRHFLIDGVSRNKLGTVSTS